MAGLLCLQKKLLWSSSVFGDFLGNQAAPSPSVTAEVVLSQRGCAVLGHELYILNSAYGSLQVLQGAGGQVGFTRKASM